MERLPRFEIIGDVPDYKKEQVAEEKREMFKKQKELLPEEARKKLEAAEYEKTPEQIAILNFINDETNRLLIESGVEPFDIPVDNYYILPPKEFKEFLNTESRGAYSDNGKAIGLSSSLRENLLQFAVVAFHEALHMKARHISEAWINKDGNLRDQIYRSGIKVESSYKKDTEGRVITHFSGIDEAIVAWQEKLSFSKLLEIPELAVEKEKYYSDKGRAERKRISKNKGVPEDEIFWTEETDKLKFFGVGYVAQRRVLEYVCEEIKNEFGSDFSTKEDVFKEFLKVNFNSNLIPIARLMKKTFGPDGLRILAMVKSKDGISDTNNVLEMLKKLRSREKTQKSS